MILTTVTLNPALDCYLTPEQLELGAINRYGECCFQPGGKGVNISLLLSSLGLETVAIGIGAGFSGKELVRLVEQAGCRTEFLFLPEGNTRLNVKVRTPDGTETDLNGGGAAVPPEAVEQLMEKLDPLQPGDALVLAGSLPASLPEDTYGKLLQRVAGKELLTVVDAAGDALRAVLPYKPFLIKPNLEELGGLFGVTLTDTAAAAECALELQKQGARNVAVSMGSKGALLLCEDGRRLFCRAAKGRTVSTVGAGDSMVAGFLYGWQLHGTLEGALRWGVCAGSATAFTKGIASGGEVLRLYPQAGNVYPV